MAGELPQTALPGNASLGVRYVFHRILPVARSSDWVMIADGWLSSWVFHSSAPLALSIARTAPPPPNGPWLPITSVLSVNAGVARALSPGIPV